jgi:hypothetical protein
MLCRNFLILIAKKKNCTITGWACDDPFKEEHLMARFDRKFDEVFDDIYCSEHFAQYVKDDAVPITQDDLRTRFALAFMFGESIVVPDSLLVDHDEMFSLIRNYKWCSFLFGNDLLKIAHFIDVTNWDAAIHNYSGANPDHRPIGMSSNRTPCRLAQEAWEKNEYGKASEIWIQGYPNGEEVFAQILPQYAPIGGQNAIPITYKQRYYSYLSAALSDSDRYLVPGGAYLELFRNHIAKNDNRDSAIAKIVHLLRTEKLLPNEAGNLTRLAIKAKHHQFYEGVNASIYGQTTSVQAMQASFCRKNKTPVKSLFDDVTFLDRLLYRPLDLNDFEALADSTRFVEMRDELVQMRRREANGPMYGAKLHELCNHAGSVLGERAGAGGRIAWAPSAAVSADLMLQAIMQLASGNVLNAVLNFIAGGIILVAVPKGHQLLVNKRLSDRVEGALRSLQDVP